MSVCSSHKLIRRFVGKDFVLLASDQSAGRSIIKMKSDENKIRQLSPGLCMAYGGEPGQSHIHVCYVDDAYFSLTGDTGNFVDYVERNLRLYQIRFALHLSTQLIQS
jgi:20S proteasome subunit beta 4